MQAIKHRPLLAIQLVAIAAHSLIYGAPVPAVRACPLMFVLLVRRFN